MGHAFRIGADENGLGPQLGPLVVTAVLAEITGHKAEALWTRLPKRLHCDLDDSKRLVAHGKIALGEAWARALTGNKAETPAALFATLSLESLQQLQAPCPSSAFGQCWNEAREQFSAAPELVTHIEEQLRWLQDQGLRIAAVKTSITCTKLLNDAKLAGSNRFAQDLHSMERLVLHSRTLAGGDVLAVCGKVGGITDYSRFFGPLSQRLHTKLIEQRSHSAYHFPGLGELHFVQDADGHDPLVMMASLVGKYVRELLMARIASHYALTNAQGEPFLVSGYNDPRTNQFVKLTSALRRKAAIPHTCFKRSVASPAR